MHEIGWCGFLGAWLLVAGPIHQAVLELSDERFDDERFDRARDKRAPHVSRWWWLLPPVWFVLQRRLAEHERRAVISELSPALRRTLVEYINTTTGWLYVAGGGFLLALKETWELHAAYAWPVWTFWVLAAGMLALCVTNTAVRFERARGALAADSAV